jgi:signal transduction histidine kinase
MVDTVIRNLLSNATKFTPVDGKIVVSAVRLNDEIEISIRDTGVGIPEKNLDNIFKLDSKTNTVGTENETGTGLGLILCKEFVEKNGGRIWVESEVGKGSTFRFTVPV